MGGIFGGGQAVEGVSSNVNERNQRLQEWLAQQSASSSLDVRAIANKLIGGGEFVPGVSHVSGVPISGAFGSQPTGPAFNLVQGGLESEEQLSRFRQNLANTMLNEAPGNLYANRRFQLGAVDQGFGNIGQQGELLNRSIGSFDNAQGLNNQLTGNISDFFSSGGAASAAQQGNINDIFNAQRAMGTSNLNQQFENNLRLGEEQFATRGLRAQDTPAQELTGRTIDEYNRNLTNLELGLGGQQAAASLNVPFQQAQLGGQLQGQSNNQMLNLINAFSSPINTGFNAGNQLQGLNAFGAQYSPASYAGPPLQNLGALLSGTNPAPVNPIYNQAGIAQNPGFGETLGQNVASSLGQGLGSGLSLGASSLVGGLGGGGATPPATSGLNLPPGVMQPLTPF